MLITRYDKSSGSADRSATHAHEAAQHAGTVTTRHVSNAWQRPHTHGVFTRVRQCNQQPAQRLLAAPQTCVHHHLRRTNPQQPGSGCRVRQAVPCRAPPMPFLAAPTHLPVRLTVHTWHACTRLSLQRVQPGRVHTDATACAPLNTPAIIWRINFFIHRDTLQQQLHQLGLLCSLCGPQRRWLHSSQLQEAAGHLLVLMPYHLNPRLLPRPLRRLRPLAARPCLPRYRRPRWCARRRPCATPPPPLPALQHLWRRRGVPRPPRALRVLRLQQQRPRQVIWCARGIR